MNNDNIINEIFISSTVPVYLVWLKYISWYYYAFDSILIIIWTSVGSIPCSIPSIDGCESQFCIANGATILKELNIDPVII